MNSAFYPKMAAANISKNRKTYFPYIIMSIFSIMMYYMMSSIINNHDIQTMPHGVDVLEMMKVGIWVARIFTVIFIFYINSFLIKRRKKEIGLYNILGMEKRHISIMMFFETLYVAVAAIAAGILLGIVFAKLMFLLLMKLIAAETVPTFEVPIASVIGTILLFAAIFGLTYCYNLTKIHLSNAIELLHGGEIGEKEPKTKLLLTIIGIFCLGCGYYFALIVESPISAMNFFLLAVILVVIGTYALFTAGSIALLKLLRKKKSFYYKTGHFMSVSGMLYRMKQNAVGLANICILSTMVLISVSTTVSMYAGIEDSLKGNYPNEINISGDLTSYEDSVRLDAEIERINQKYGVQMADYSAAHSITLMGVYDGNGIYSIAKEEDRSVYTISNTVLVAVMNLEEFNVLNGTDYTLSQGEVLLYSSEKELRSQNSIVMGIQDKICSYHVKHQLSRVNSKVGVDQVGNIMKCSLIVVDGKQEFEKIYQLLSSQGSSLKNMDYSVGYNTNLSVEKSKELAKELNEIALDNIVTSTDNQYDMRNTFRQLYGSFLFIGIFVGLLFLMATTLIIYYKQISEGYDDQERFIILQNVGMSREEVKKTIHSQVLLVFFLPLGAAAIHVAVSFRIIKMILAMLSLGNTPLFAACTILTIFVFCAIYGIVYLITARSYYNIVKIEA